MAGFFQSGQVVDCILGFMAAEVIVLILVRIHGSPLFGPREIIAGVGAGAALLLALRAALRGGAWDHVAAWLLVALGLHLWDLRVRWSMRRPK